MNHVKLRGVMPSAHFPRSLGGISLPPRVVRTNVECEATRLGAACSFAGRAVESLPMTLDPPAATDLGGRLRHPAGDGEHPLDRGSVGRVLGRSASGERRAGRVATGAAVSALASVRVDRRRQLVEQIVVVAQQVGLAGQHRHQVALRRASPSAAAVRGAPGCAGSAGSRLDGIVRRPRAQLACADASVSLRRKRQERPAWAGSHRRQPAARGAAEQVDQHGLGLVVGGVAGEHVGRAAPRSGRSRGRASRFGPSRDRDRLGAERRTEPSAAAVRPRPRRPSRLAARGRRAPRSPSNRQRRPGRAGRSSRRRRRPRRSRSVPAGGNVHRASRSCRVGRARCQATSAPMRSSHSVGLRISSREGRFSGAVQQTIDGSRSALGLDCGDEPFTCGVLVELGLDAGEAQHQTAERVGSSAPSLQDRSNRGSRRNQVADGAAHGDVAVALEQRHQSADALR